LVFLDHLFAKFPIYDVKIVRKTLGHPMHTRQTGGRTDGQMVGNA